MTITRSTPKRTTQICILSATLLASCRAFSPTFPLQRQNYRPIHNIPSCKRPSSAISRIYTKKTEEPSPSNDDDSTDLDISPDLEKIAIPPPPQPTLVEIRNFALPCIALWTSGSVLSLVDTASVGLSALPGTGATQLGALGPATNSIDAVTYLFAFLNVATTNLYASALAESEDADEKKRAGERVVRTAIKISLICGFASVLFLLSFVGKATISTFIGSSAGSKEILDLALPYVWIRGLSLPTSLLYGVLQAALLGAKDSVTPLIAVAASTLVNVVGDYICVFKLGMGLKGAAIATLLAQWAGTLAVLGPAKRKLFMSQSFRRAKDENNEKIKTDRVGSLDFLTFATPVLTLILGKIAIFGLMTHVSASFNEKTALAAHQIVLSFFFCVSPCLEVISQTAQTFLPQFYVRPSNIDAKSAVEWKEASEKLSLRLLRLGTVAASALAVLCASVTLFFPNLLTKELTVQAAVRPLSLPLALGALLTAPVAVSEGILLAKRELKYLAGVYVLTTALLPPFLLRLKKLPGATVGDVWMFFVGFQLIRAVLFTGKLWGGGLWGRIRGRKFEQDATLALS